MDPLPHVPLSAIEAAEEKAEPQQERTYVSIGEDQAFDFDPLKDLNLPGSYAEVTSRFRRLQVNRAMEVLN